MKPIIMDMKDISDSTEVYESRPNPFLIYFIYFLGVMFVICLIWMAFSKIDIVVKSNGMFKSQDEVYNVSSSMTGKVVTVYAKDGQFVNEGDVLYTLEVTSLGETIEYYQSELNNINERLDILQGYINYLDGDEKALDSFIDNVYYKEIFNRKKLFDINKESSTGKSVEAAFYQENIEVLSEILTIQSKKDEYENYLKKYDIQDDNCKVKAHKSGYFYLQQNIKEGTYIQEGTTLGTIYLDVYEKFMAQIYVDNSQIAKIKEGQQVKFEIAAYPSSEYGYFTGKVINIHKDITVDKTTGAAYYVVEVSCDSKSLKSKDGDAATLMNGMACQARIVVDEENVLEYLLRKIDLLD